MLRKHKWMKAGIIVLSAILAIMLFLALWSAAAEPQAHIAPDYPQEDILPILSKEHLTSEDYELLYKQTGLGKPAVDEFRAIYPDPTGKILSFQKLFFSDVRYICEKNSPISREESLVDEKGNLVNVELAPVHNGDILITKSSHTYGWRNGHAAIVIDAKQGRTLESVVLGTDSLVQDISKWTNYPNFMLLRLKNADEKTPEEIAKTAEQVLSGVPYDFSVGVFNPKFKNRDEITGTQCSHLVWEAFALYGYDLDSDGGRIVTPKDIANSPLLEVVQIFGTNPDQIWP